MKLIIISLNEADNKADNDANNVADNDADNIVDVTGSLHIKRIHPIILNKII